MILNFIYHGTFNKAPANIKLDASIYTVNFPPTNKTEPHGRKFIINLPPDA